MASCRPSSTSGQVSNRNANS